MTEFEYRISEIVKQLKERFNMAISEAVNEKKTFEDGEKIFTDTISVLDYYNCFDLESDQLVNFSKVAFFRKKYDKALYYATEAIQKAKSQERIDAATENLHSMAFRIFEILLVTTEDFHDQIDLEDLQDYLTPEDYCIAMKNTFGARNKIKTDEDRNFISGVIKTLSQELVKQGIRQKKNGDTKSALLLFKTVFPYLNPKRAAIISNEIQEMEAANA